MSIRLAAIIPPGTEKLWLKVVAKNLSIKHPEIVVVAPVEDRFRLQLERYGVPIEGPPIPRRWYARLWFRLFPRRWDPAKECDVALILWDQSKIAVDALRDAHLAGKKIWIVRMDDRGKDVTPRTG